MTVSIESAALVRAVRLVDRMAESKSTVPAMAALLLSAQLGALVVSHSGYDSSISLELKARDVDATGWQAAVNARAFYGILRKLGRGALVDLQTESETGNLVIASGRSRYKLATLKPSDLPCAKAFDCAGSFEVDAVALVDLLGAAAPAVSVDPTRPYLEGVFIHGDGADVRAVATNGHFLLSAALESPRGAALLETLPSAHHLRPGLLIPTAQIDILRRGLVDGLASGVATVTLGADGWRVMAGGLLFAGRTVDGIFPDYRKVIPTDEPCGAWTVDADAAAAFYEAQGGKAAAKRYETPPGVIARFADGAPIETCQAVDGAAPRFLVAPGQYTGADLVKGLRAANARACFALFGSRAVRVEVRQGSAAPFLINCASGAVDLFAVAMPVGGEFLDPVAPRRAYAPTFPGMAADVSTIKTGCESMTAIRVANADEIRAYLRDLCARAGLPWLGLETGEHNSPGALGRSILIGRRVAKSADYVDGSYSLLIPGGARDGESVTFETLDADGATVATLGLRLSEKKSAGLPIEAAAVLAASGLVEVKGRKARRTIIAPRVAIAPAPVDVAPVEAAAPGPVEVETVDPVALVPVRIANGVDNWRPVDALRHHITGAIERGEAVAIEAIEAAPVDLVETVDAPAAYIADYVAPIDAPAPAGPRAAVEAPAVDLVDVDALQDAQDVAQAPSAPVDVPDPAADLLRRLAAVEAALGLVPAQTIAKRAASHARAVRIAWAARRAMRERADLDRRALLAANGYNRQLSEENAAIRGRVAALESVADRANEQAEKAFAKERAHLEAELSAAIARAENENREAVKVSHVMRRRYVQFATVARGAVKLRRDLARARVERDGLAVNLQAVARRAVDDAALIERLRPASPIVEQGAPRRFILSSR